MMDPAKSIQKGAVVLVTGEGGIHEIGKNILGRILSTAGWEIIDLGINIPADTIRDDANGKTAGKGTRIFDRLNDDLSG